MFQNKTMDLAPTKFFCENPGNLDQGNCLNKASSLPGVLPAKTRESGNCPWRISFLTSFVIR